MYMYIHYVFIYLLEIKRNGFEVTIVYSLVYVASIRLFFSKPSSKFKIEHETVLKC